MHQPASASASRRLRRLAMLLSVWLAVALAGEILLELCLLAHRWANGGNVAILADRLLLARPLLGPFIPGGKAGIVRALPGIAFVGDVDDPSGSRRFYPADALLGHRIAPSVGLTRALRDGSDRQAWHASTPQGFAAAGDADTVFAIPKPANVFRVIVLGGSTVEGVGALHPGDNLPAMLARRLAQKPGWAGREIEIINAGVGSYDLRDSFLYLFGELLRYRPDLVIAYGGWNDILAVYDRDDGAHRRAGLRQAKHDEAPRALNRGYDLAGGALLFAEAAARSVLRAARQTGWYGALEALLVTPDEAADNAAGRAGLSAFEDAARLYRLVLELAIAGARAEGFRFAAILQPLMGIDGKNYTPEELRLLARLGQRQRDGLVARQDFYARLRAVHDELGERHRGAHGICLADLSGALAKTSFRAYRDTGHLLPAANGVMADAIAAQLAECAIGPPP